MSKIAICIAGEMRYWEITKNIFNSLDADIFISTFVLDFEGIFNI